MDPQDLATKKKKVADMVAYVEKEKARREARRLYMKQYRDKDRDAYNAKRRRYARNKKAKLLRLEQQITEAQQDIQQQEYIAKNLLGDLY